MNTDGSGQTRLTFGPSAEHFPAWQPIPVGVGGIAELPEVAETRLEAASSGVSASVVANFVTAVAAGALALGGAAWYARRRSG